MLKNQKGFTLIELLIVIVIIGILAGVLIAVIDPVKQQNRAKDAGVQATMNKVALATEGFLSAYGRAPDDVEFIASLQNATPRAVGASNACANGRPNAGWNTCEFNITGNNLMAADSGGTSCSATSYWSGLGTADCYYHYFVSTAAGDEGHFKLFARSFGIANTVFMYDNKMGEITECNTTTVADVNNIGCN